MDADRPRHEPNAMPRRGENPRPLRVVIADDHDLFRESLARLLAMNGIEIAGLAGTCAEALKLVRETRPDIVLVDLGMPDTHGLEACRAVLEDLPGTRVIVLTGATGDDELVRALEAGVHGYLPKTTPPDRFVACLEQARAGELVLAPELAARAVSRAMKADRKADSSASLTTREQELVALVASGITATQDLADRLFVSANTIKFHMRNVLSKLGLHSRAELVGWALRHGFPAGDPGA